MLIRYRRSPDGKPVAKALVYTQEEHHINRSAIDPDALRIVERLRENGHETYIVGGAVRDLLLGRRPKDFDIVTDAQPARIKRIFRSARVIGRRFRLVHVYAGPKIFEVCTFRSIANGTVGNEFGTIDEDAQRRDFTLNALYYDPYDSTLVDYVGGFKDMAAKRIVPVIPLDRIFKEDAVRMIRCIKYSSTTGFAIPWRLRRTLKRDSNLLAEASHSRLTEEFIKILGSGNSAPIIDGLDHYDLLKHLLPQAAKLYRTDKTFKASMLEMLKLLDEKLSDSPRDKTLALFLSFFLKPYLERKVDRFADSPEAYRDAVQDARLFLMPLNPPRVELETAILMIFKKKGVAALPRPKRMGRGESFRREGEVRRGENRIPGKSASPARGESKVVLEEGGPSLQEHGQNESPSSKRRRRRKRHYSSAQISGNPASGEPLGKTDQSGDHAENPPRSSDRPQGPGNEGITGGLDKS